MNTAPRHDERDRDSVSIECRETTLPHDRAQRRLRAHPERRATADPFGLPNAVAPVTSEWVRRSIDHALDGRYSLLLEGTFRDPDVVAETIRRFAAAGYRTEVVVLAVRQERSRLDSLLRFINPGAVAPGRWTPPSAHDTAHERLPESVRRLEDVAELDRVTVWRRSAEVYTNERGPGQTWRRPGRAHDALVEERGRPFDAVEAREWLKLYQGVMLNALADGGVDPRVVAVCAALHVDADRVAEMAYPDPGDPERERHAATHQQLAAALECQGGNATSSADGAATPAQARLARAFPPMIDVDPAAASSPMGDGGDDRESVRPRRSRGR
jgi:hypothetical protein